MGNSFRQDYREIQEKNGASGGPEQLWAIYDAKSKLTNENVSLWVLTKSALPQSDQASIVELFKKDIVKITKLRHPNIVRVTKGLTEDKETLVFETEPIFASLANILRDHKNVGEVSPILDAYNLEPLEVKMGFLQLCSAIDFLHEKGQTVHLNISPENVYLTKDGVWKLAGFHFASLAENIEIPKVSLQPNFNYAAPDSFGKKTISYAVDMFSLGCLLYRVLNQRGVLNCKNMEAYKRDIQTIIPLKRTTNLMPDKVAQIIEAMLALNPGKRITIKQFLDSDYFKDVLIRTVNYLANINEKSDDSKCEFYKRLTQALPEFTTKILTTKILPPLLLDLRSEILVPVILPNIFWMVDFLKDKAIFNNTIFPCLVKVFSIVEPYQIVMGILKYAELIFAYSTPENIATHVIPFIVRTFSHEKTEVLMGLLHIAPSIAPHMDKAHFNEVVLPKIEALCLNSSHDPIRVKALQCYSHFAAFFSQQDVTERIFPTLVKCAFQKSTPSVRVAIVGACAGISVKAGEQFTASKILPFIIPLMIDREMNTKQFNVIINIIRTMMERIEAMRRKELPLEPASTTQASSTLATPLVESFDPFSAMHLTVTKPAANGAPTVTSNGGLPNINLVQVSGSELLSSPNNSVNNALNSLNAIKVPSNVINVQAFVEQMPLGLPVTSPTSKVDPDFMNKLQNKSTHNQLIAKIEEKEKRKDSAGEFKFHFPEDFPEDKNANKNSATNNNASNLLGSPLSPTSNAASLLGFATPLSPSSTSVSIGQPQMLFPMTASPSSSMSTNNSNLLGTVLMPTQAATIAPQQPPVYSLTPTSPQSNQVLTPLQSTPLQAQPQAQQQPAILPSSPTALSPTILSPHNVSSPTALPSAKPTASPTKLSVQASSPVVAISASAWSDEDSWGEADFAAANANKGRKLSNAASFTQPSVLTAVKPVTLASFDVDDWSAEEQPANPAQLYHNHDTEAKGKDNGLNQTMSYSPAAKISSNSNAPSIGSATTVDDDDDWGDDFVFETSKKKQQQQAEANAALAVNLSHSSPIPVLSPTAVTLSSPMLMSPQLQSPAFISFQTSPMVPQQEQPQQQPPRDRGVSGSSILQPALSGATLMPSNFSSEVDNSSSGSSTLTPITPNSSISPVSQPSPFSLQFAFDSATQPSSPVSITPIQASPMGVPLLPHSAPTQPSPFALQFPLDAAQSSPMLVPTPLQPSAALDFPASSGSPSQSSVIPSFQSPIQPLQPSPMQNPLPTQTTSSALEFPSVTLPSTGDTLSNLALSPPLQPSTTTLSFDSPIPFALQLPTQQDSPSNAFAQPLVSDSLAFQSPIAIQPPLAQQQPAMVFEHLTPYVSPLQPLSLNTSLDCSQDSLIPYESSASTSQSVSQSVSPFPSSYNSPQVSSPSLFHATESPSFSQTAVSFHALSIGNDSTELAPSTLSTSFPLQAVSPVVSKPDLDDDDDWGEVFPAAQQHQHVLASPVAFSPPTTLQTVADGGGDEWEEF